MTVFRQRFNNGAEIDAIYTDTKNTRTAHCVQGFQNDVMMFPMKSTQTVFIGR